MSFVRPALLDEKAVSRIIGISIQSLRNSRSKGSKGNGLPYVKIGRRVLYDPADLEAFIDKSRVDVNARFGGG